MRIVAMIEPFRMKYFKTLLWLKLLKKENAFVVQHGCIGECTCVCYLW